MKYELQDNSARFEEDMNFASIKLNNGMDGANSSIQERERLEKQEAIKKPMPIGSVVTTDSNALKMMVKFMIIWDVIIHLE